MPAQLCALNEGPAILLDKPILLLGRDLECDIRLDSRKISRRHCCIAQVGETLVIRDLGSTNGVRINGTRVVEGRLKAGDELTIGNFRYKVYWGDAPPSSVRPEKQEKQAPRQVLTDRPPNEDELLEEYDEPVPLNEPAAGAASAPRAKPIPAPSGPAPEGPTFKSEPPPHNPNTQILPDDIELAPPSDVYPDLPKPQPGTGNSSIKQP
jgi:pSer/pThr/pTyr-binding forkhead associated (FHA) protein